VKKIFVVIIAILVLGIVGISVLGTQAETYYSVLVNALNLNPISANHPATPIKHLIFVINENHAFDNMFGTYPNLPTNYALNLSTCMPYLANQTSAKPCLKPFNADRMPMVQETDICHTSGCAVGSYNNGHMNGILQTVKSNYSMSYYDGNGIPQIWDLASYYALNYNFFSSAMSYSEPNHLYIVAANSPRAVVETMFVPWNLTYPEIGTAMTEAGVSWGYFQYNWNDSLDCSGNYSNPYVLGNIKGGFDGFWSGEAQFRAVQDTVIECSSLGNIVDFENALKTNTLPQVSFVIPQPSESGHPGQGSWASNQLFITSVVDMIESSSIWNSSATFVTWDDWGGYYDGVIPTQLDAFGDGFRVPLIAISPYSIPGGLIGPCAGTQSVACTPTYNYYNNYTNDHGMTNQGDFSAFLSTIEYNWGVRPIAIRDAEEPNLFYMLNFSQTPLKPLFFNSNYNLSAYPLSSCYTSRGCQTGTPFLPLSQQSVYNASTPPWAETSEQALANAGNGDADD
jgi:phospholipase C